MLYEVITDPGNPPLNDVLGDITPTVFNTWRDTIDTAERYNEPGVFTALLGWEWTSTPAGANLHRVVITAEGRDAASRYAPS